VANKDGAPFDTTFVDVGRNSLKGETPLGD